MDTEANPRFTFPQHSARRGRAHVQGLVVFAVYYAVTSGALLVLDRIVPDASRALEVLVVVVSSVLGTVLRFALLRRWVFAPKNEGES